MATVGMKRQICEVIDVDAIETAAPSKLRRCPSLELVVITPASESKHSPSRNRVPKRSICSLRTPRNTSVNEPTPLTDCRVVNKITLAKKFEPSMNVSGWVMSEKLDGMRALWHNGALYSRAGNKIHAPAYFTASLPQGFTLDGELWMGRGCFQDVMSVCRSTKESPRWKTVKFMVFDAPDVSGGILKRLEHAKEAIRMAQEILSESAKESEEYVEVLDHTISVDKNQVQEELRSIERKGGEGLILRHPTDDFRGGRTRDLLKVKSSKDDEALVIGHDRGSGKNLRCLGALVCRSRTGKRFKVGSGFSDQEREMPPASNSVITYKFFELTKAGIPRFPIFDRIRPDVSASDFEK